MSELRKKLLEGRKLESFSRVLEDTSTPAVCPGSERDTANRHFKENFHKRRDALLPIRDRYYFDAYHYVQTYYLPPSLPTSPVLICHHGAGSSGLTFLAFVSELVKICPSDHPGVFFFDMFDHGISTERKSHEYGLEELTADFSFVLDKFVQQYGSRQLFFVGHSLGGAIMSNFLVKHENKCQVSGLVLIDIVEETAIRSLNAMPSFLRLRPKTFQLYDDAVDWHLKTRILRNEDSAKLSIHDMLQGDDMGNLHWRTDLERMAPFWKDWFIGMSDHYLLCDSYSNKHIAKLLILAGNENLDKTLIVGQMQGKYQLIVFNNSDEIGHFVQEDSPSKLCISIMEFIRRHDVNSKERKHSSIRTLWGGDVH